MALLRKSVLFLNASLSATSTNYNKTLTKTTNTVLGQNHKA